MSSVAHDDAGTAASHSVLLLEPHDGVPAVLERRAELRAALEPFTASTGPVAFDAERASGYRYGQRAYLVQLRRPGAGTLLLDPIALADLTPVERTFLDDEWVIHAATQDLPCLAEVGLVPHRLFDTELAGRLLGYPRVALGTLVETLLGYTLEKGLASVDWSTRPLPHDWLVYAALDVELLVELRDRLEGELDAAGKLDWARQEFAHLLTVPPRPPQAEPWRRTSGIHRVRDPRALAIVRSLWFARDQLARQRDSAPGRVLADNAIVETALAAPRTIDAVREVPGVSARRGASAARTWLAAVQSALAEDEQDLPTRRQEGNGLPPTNRWSDKQPEAATRLTAVREALAVLSERLLVPVENLLPPAAVRQLAWQPPETVSAASVGDALRDNGAREWQVEVGAADLARALAS
ncbi:MAG: ribonuclease D [Streptosporangiales bacterium]|nr:ribonuclease D [Streptosporangiales bacterium]